MLSSKASPSHKTSKNSCSCQPATYAMSLLLNAARSADDPFLNALSQHTAVLCSHWTTPLLRALIHVFTMVA